jgi:N-acetyl-beta-hexosaminidase
MAKVIQTWYIGGKEVSKLEIKELAIKSGFLKVYPEYGYKAPPFHLYAKFLMNCGVDIDIKTTIND